MSNDLTIKKETLERDLLNLLKSVKEKTEPNDSIKIYENLIISIKETLEKIEHPKQKCSSCGEPLDAWERGTCGPCKIKDERYEEEY